MRPLCYRRQAGEGNRVVVYRVGGAKAAFLGHVTAPNEETALALAYDESNVTTPAGRKRIIVHPTSSAE